MVIAARFREVHPVVSGEDSFGFTLLELIVATAILIILSGMALPLARVSIKRERERQLRNCSK
jgi:prepilin-type N-terminal cleavage/methylation domain-containing protein